VAQKNSQKHGKATGTIVTREMESAGLSGSNSEDGGGDPVVPTVVHHFHER